jgi:hypothetical protein
MDQGIGGEKEKLSQQPLQTSFAAEQRNKGLMAIATKASPQTGREDNKGAGHQQPQSSATLQTHSVRPPQPLDPDSHHKRNLNPTPREALDHRDESSCETRQSFFISAEQTGELRLQVDIRSGMHCSLRTDIANSDTGYQSWLGCTEVALGKQQKRYFDPGKLSIKRSKDDDLGRSCCPNDQANAKKK